MTVYGKHTSNSERKCLNQATFFARYGNLLCYFFSLLFYLWMAAQIPYTHDDWDWGLEIGLNQLFHATINSRYVGNAFVVLMTRSAFLKTLIMGSSFFLIPFFLACLACQKSQKLNNHHVIVFLFCNILLLTQKKSIMAQTYNWVSGFANFGISVLFLMIWIKAIIDFFDSDYAQKKLDVKKCILYSVFGICGNLFLENIALYTVMLGVVICVWSIIRDRKVSSCVLSLTCGAIIGLCVMFSSSIYHSLFTVGTAVDGYREVPLIGNNSVFEILIHVLSRILVLGVRIYADNFVLCIAILTILTYLLYQSRRTFSGMCVANIVILCMLIPCQIYDVICMEHSQLLYFYDFIVSIAFFAVVSIEVWILFRSEKLLMQRMYVVWLSAPAIIAPLIATTEIGHRLFLNSNVFLILFFAMLLEQAMLFYSHQNMSVRLLRIGSLCIAILLLINGFMYGKIGACKRNRDAIMKEAVQTGEGIVILPSYPFEDYLCNPNPTQPIRIEYFKQFYDLPEEMTVIFR